MARESNVDINTVKLLVEAYPQSLMTTSEEDMCYPIHALFLNQDTNNLQEIVEYIFDYEPSSLRVLDRNGVTPLNLACRNSKMNAEIVQLLYNAWSESIRMADHNEYLPIHSLCPESATVISS